MDGYVEITGNSYFEAAPVEKPQLAELERGTIQNLNNGTMIITGGTIIATKQHGISNEATLTLGTKDGDPNTTPVIIGTKYGVLNIGTFNYYDGIIQGITSATSGEITGEDEVLQKIEDTEIINDKEYKTVYLELKDTGE